MATKRDIKNRIKSITNTKKITGTMEMVAGAKMKKMQQRLGKSKPYEDKINQIMGDILAKDGSVDDPLLKGKDKPVKALIFQISGNRGLCGSYNSHSIDTTLKFKKQLEAEGKEVSLYVIGKKGINFYNFTNEPMYRSMSNPEDKFNFDDAAKIGSELTSLFLKGEFDEVYVSYTKVVSSSTQKPAVMKYLPVSADAAASSEKKDSGSDEYIFEPDENQIFSYLLPLYLKMKIFTCFLESGFSEQFLRRVAMKNASDASSDMIRDLTVTYNRVRQSKITNEISEIVGGASALE